MKTYFGSNIRALRKRKDVTQSQISGQLNYESSTISGWEKGKSFPNFETLLWLAEYFEVSLDDLVYKDLSQTDMVEEGQARYEHGIIPATSEDLKTLWGAIREMEGRLRQLEQPVGK